MAKLDDVAKEAQDRGYRDGNNNRAKLWKRYGYTGHLKAAYVRGWNLGRRDYERTFQC